MQDRDPQPAPQPTEPKPPPGIAWCVKRGIAYGLAAGMLAGLIYVALIDAPQPQEIILWRNFILAGGGIGLVCGLVVGIFLRRKSRGAAR